MSAKLSTVIINRILFRNFYQKNPIKSSTFRVINLTERTWEILNLNFSSRTNFHGSKRTVPTRVQWSNFQITVRSLWSNDIRRCCCPHDSWVGNLIPNNSAATRNGLQKRKIAAVYPVRIGEREGIKKNKIIKIEFMTNRIDNSRISRLLYTGPNLCS